MKLKIQLFAEDGSITIGIKLNTKQFDKDIVELYEEIQQNSEKQLEIKASIKETEKVRDVFIDLKEQLENSEITAEELGEVLSGMLNEEQIAPIRQMTNYFEDTEATTQVLNEYVKEFNSNIAQSKDNLINAKLEASKLREELSKTKKEGNFFQRFTSNAKKGFAGLVKSVVKWSMALLAVRGVYSLLSNAASQLQQTNKQAYTDLQYMKYALASALEPVISKIVEWVTKLMSYIGIIIYRLTGINIFAKATASNFAKASKSAKEMNKSLAGFDEITKVSSSSGASSGAGELAPSIDLSKVIDDEQLNQNLDNAEKEVMNWSTRLSKFWSNDWEQAFDDLNDYLFGGLFSNMMKGIGLWCKGVYDILVGLGEMIIGIIDMLIGIFTGDMEKVKEGFKIFCKGLLDIVLGLGEMIAGVVLITIGAVVDLIVGGAKLAWSGIKKVWEVAGEFFSSVGTSISSAISGAWSKLTSGATSAWKSIQSVFSSVGTFFSNTFEKAWKKVKDIFSTGGKIFDGIKDGIASAFKTIVNKLIDGINKIVKTPFEKINSMLNTIHDISILGVEPFKKLWSKNPISIPSIPKLAKGGIINNPGRGVAIGGEAGREGVIPLTDTQQMELLGETIGRFITINLTNNTNLDGRTIARQTSKVNSNKNFAMNR